MHADSPTQTRTIYFPKWVDWLWLVACAIYILAGVPQTPYHGDEATIIYMGRDFYYHMQGETDRLHVQPFDALDGDAALEQHLRLINGTLPKYTYGAIGYAMGIPIDDLSAPWSWGLGWDWNMENGSVPSGSDLLLAMRYGSAIFLALSVLVLFRIGEKVGGRAVAYIATAYYVLNPAILVNGRRAMMEGPLLFFSLLVILIGLNLLHHRRWYMYVLFGIVSGLCVAAKHPGVLTVALAFLALGSASLWQAYQRRTWQFAATHIAGLFGAGLLSLAIFFALNPSWWQNPSLALQLVLSERSKTLQSQSNSFDGTSDLTIRAQRFYFFALINHPMYSEVEFFKPYITVEVDAYEATPWRGISIGGRAIGAAILVGLMLIGTFLLIRRLSYRSWLILIWSIGTVVFTLAATPLPWQRYYLAVFPIFGLLAAIGIIGLLTLITTRRLPQLPTVTAA